MRRPFGHTLHFSLALSRSWLSLGPGWAALAGALSTGLGGFELSLLLQLFVLWLLVDPVLGTLWDLSTRQELWRSIRQAQLPPAPVQGFYLPYAQPGTVAGRLVLLWRRYGVWWREFFWPESGDRVTAFALGGLLALLLALFLGPVILALTALAIGLVILAGQHPPDLGAASGGRWQSVVQFLLPWLMGTLLWSRPALFSLALGLCFWGTYLGGLRMLDGHRRAELLFFLGQAGALLVLLALRLLPGGALLAILLAMQGLLKSNFDRPVEFLSKAQPYLVLGLLVAGISLGTL